MTDFRCPLFGNVLQAVWAVNGETHQNNVCVWVGERPQTIVVFLSCVREREKRDVMADMEEEGEREGRREEGGETEENNEVKREGERKREEKEGGTEGKKERRWREGGEREGRRGKRDEKNKGKWRETKIER